MKPPSCTGPDCSRPAEVGELCRAHNMQKSRGRALAPLSRQRRRHEGALWSCSTCREMKDVSEFTWHASRGEPQRQCKRCRADDRLCLQHGLTRDELHTLQQDKRCAICGKLDGSNAKALHLDHDHETGRIRGWLCSQHNVALGMFSDSVADLQAAIRYLQG